MNQCTKDHMNLCDIALHLGKHDADNQDKKEGHDAEFRGLTEVKHEDNAEEHGKYGGELDQSPSPEASQRHLESLLSIILNSHLSPPRINQSERL